MEAIFKLEKPETKEEFRDFKQFRTGIKALLKFEKGRLKVIEKFDDFTFKVFDCTREEEEKIAVFLKETKTVRILQGIIPV